MSENKQFTFDRDTVAPNIKTPIVFKEGERLSIGEVLDKLNELNDENKQLKEDNEFAGLLANHRGEMVSFANALIQDLDDEKIKDMWEKFKDEMYKEWKQKRGIE